jgi:hypothetical protein
MAARLLGIATRTIYRHLNRDREEPEQEEELVEFKDRETIAEPLAAAKRKSASVGA